jgi:hypothetical protein
MEMVEVLQEILQECLLLPEAERDTEDKLAFFSLDIVMQDRFDFTKFDYGDPYQHIKAYLVHELLVKK